ncbi:MAG TPA: hypothetical protein GX401_02905 [Clostridiales bacterium]|nr:hypothetical protein [Clostridiales bacterium]
MLYIATDNANTSHDARIASTYVYTATPTLIVPTQQKNGSLCILAPKNPTPDNSVNITATTKLALLDKEKQFPKTLKYPVAKAVNGANIPPKTKNVIGVVRSLVFFFIRKDAPNKTNEAKPINPILIPDDR